MTLLFTFSDIFSSFFLIYALILFIIYVLISILSTVELRRYVNKNKYFDYRSILSYKNLPSISIIAPAFNEEKSIIENIRSLLSIYYPQINVIIVNDGSTDDSLSKAIEHYGLIKVEMAIEYEVKSSKIRGIYRSIHSEYANLILVDKENGGKADALNAGINVSRSDLFVAVDVDSIIEPDAVLRLVKPFLEEERGRKVISSGGVIRVANNCEIKDGRITKVRFPKALLVKFQVLEYFRAFTLGRMAWSKVDGLLIISGAFGMFDRNIVVAVGGYDRTTVGEDLEIVVRMRKYMRNELKMKYKVAFIPDPLCWTEVPSSFKILSRQRNRWTRGAIDTILKHKDMMFNPRYGRIGMVSFPYWVLFEWLAPIVEVIGVVYFIILIILGDVNSSSYLLLSLFVLSFAFAFSMLGVLFEAIMFNKYKGYGYLLQVIFFALIEVIVFHPLNVYFAIRGNFSFFIKNNQKWGEMTRTAFDSENK
ncbi:MULTISPECIES: glycosyltransferase [unclassified Lentimicrobium]|uniref:glycosyltransferase family 2 protein n=1 Tax=unclassified Lentimicrobium TaxID=2677434 RepID=UPI00155422F2|nr:MULTISPECIES: glycosyltransferase [unclassified Lentimicrobium]NPD45337.1 glycosyltransferase family 2 protein [Lentimicrobium sp. S6]NPD84364.1 glycosyltransferase family 2 protein [Lentimicrobium sp. L6]